MGGKSCKDICGILVILKLAPSGKGIECAHGCPLVGGFFFLCLPIFVGVVLEGRTERCRKVTTTDILRCDDFSAWLVEVQRYVLCHFTW